MVAIDPYLNETTRHADVILPPTSPLERSHYDVALLGYAVRNIAKFSPPVFERDPDSRHDWEICLELWTRLGLPGLPLGPAGRLAGRAVRRVFNRLGPEGLLDLALRAGPYGVRRGRKTLSMRVLRGSPHGVDLGPLQPRLPARLRTTDRRIHAAPPRFLADLPRVRNRMTMPAPALVLIGRRHLHSNNSWCHNAPRLVKGPPRCVLLINPRDAAARGIVNGDLVALSSRTGRIQVTAETTDDVMEGVVSLPHGWGHARDGVRLRIARQTTGASVNDVTDEAAVDPVSGNAAVSGTPVEVARIAR
jgi:anaerobic selenocysteine-containing dehydrogenase